MRRALLLIFVGCGAATPSPLPRPRPSSIGPDAAAPVAIPPLDAGALPPPTPGCSLGAARAVSSAAGELGVLEAGLTIAARGPAVGISWSRKQYPTEDYGDPYDGTIPHLGSWTGPRFEGLAIKEVGISSGAAQSQQTAAIVVVNPKAERVAFGAALFAEHGQRGFSVTADFAGLPFAAPRFMPTGFAASTPGGGFVGASREEGPLRAVIAADGIHTPWPSFEECYQRLQEGKGHPACFSAGPPTETKLMAFPRAGKPRTHTIATPGASAIALGATRGALVLRHDGALSVVSFDAAVEKVAAPVALRKGDVGAPAIAFDGDAMWIAWAERAPPDARYRLFVARWADEPAPPAPTAIETGDAHAFAPALAVREGKVFLAWTEGDLKDHGSIHAAAWPASAKPPSALRTAPLTTTDANARDPELAAGDATWVAWTHYTKAAPRGDVMAAPLECP